MPEALCRIWPSWRHALITVVCAAAMPAGASLYATDASAQANRSARALYERGEFAEAMEAFKRELAKGSPNSSLLYNLGNACFKAGRLGEAILYYERAARLAPRDEDIQDNLALARLAAVDRFIEPPRPWPVEVFVRLHRRVTANEVAVLAAGLWWAVGLAVAARCAAVARRRQRAAAIAALVAGILLLPAGLSLAVKLYNAAYVEQAIVVVEEAELRTGPGASFGSVVTLHEGAKLTIQERRGVWVHGRMQTGGEGWVQSGHIETI